MLNNSLHFFSQKFSIKLVDKDQITIIKRVQKAGMTTLSQKIIHLTLISRNMCNLDAHSILINVKKCLAQSRRKPPRCNFRFSVYVWVIFQVRIRVSVQVPLTGRVRRTYRDIYSKYFLPKVMVKFKRKAWGHFVMLTRAGKWVSQNFSRISQISQSRFFSEYVHLAVSFFI